MRAGHTCIAGSVEARSLLATPLPELDRVLRTNLHTQFNVLKSSVKVGARRLHVESEGVYVASAGLGPWSPAPDHCC